MIVYIKTHGRPEKQYTYKALREAGYTGDITFVIDNEDEISKSYKDWSERIEIFNKQYYIDTIDSGVSNPKRNVNLYAWCACEDIAKQRNESHFIMADDDITGFRYRYEEDGHLKSLSITKNLDAIFQFYFDYMDKANICAMSFADSRVYVGGQIHESRGVYNFVFRNLNCHLDWKSNMYEETTVAIDGAKEGNYILQLPHIQFSMKGIDKKVDGGMKEIYSALSIHKRAWYPKLFNPSCIEFDNNNTGFRLLKDNAFPKLISSRCKKNKCVV